MRRVWWAALGTESRVCQSTVAQEGKWEKELRAGYRRSLPSPGHSNWMKNPHNMRLGGIYSRWGLVEFTAGSTACLGNKVPLEWRSQNATTKERSLPGIVKPLSIWSLELILVCSRAKGAPGAGRALHTPSPRGSCQGCTHTAHTEQQECMDTDPTC